MLYLLYGTKKFLIQKELKKILKGFDDLCVNKYDMSVDSAFAVINDCMTVSLFDSQKAIVCENADVFCALNNDGADDFFKYLSDPNPNTILVFIVYREKIDLRKKITKLMGEKGVVKAFNDNENPRMVVKRCLKGYQFNDNLVSLVVDRIGDNSLIIENEMEKLKLYKDDDIITLDDVLNVTMKKVDIDIFNLLDNIVMNNKDKALEIYYEMIKVNEEPIKIVIMLANQFRLMYQVKELLKKGFYEKDIASVLKVHPYRVKLSIKNGRKYTSDVLLRYISDLADIDMDIKMGKVDKFLALELFILKK